MIPRGAWRKRSMVTADTTKAYLCHCWKCYHKWVVLLHGLSVRVACPYCHVLNELIWEPTPQIVDEPWEEVE